MDICTLRRRRDQEQVESISLSMRKNSPPKWKNASTFEFGSQRSMKLEILHLFFSCLCRSEWCVFNAQQLLRTQRRTTQKAWSLLGHKAGTFRMSWAERGKNTCCEIISNQHSLGIGLSYWVFCHNGTARPAAKQILDVWPLKLKDFGEKPLEDSLRIEANTGIAV